MTPEQLIELEKKAFSKPWDIRASSVTMKLMKQCTHLKRFDIVNVHGEHPECLLCSGCVSLVVRSLRLHLELMWSAEDETMPDVESAIRLLLYKLTGERPKKPHKPATDYNREYQQRRRAKMKVKPQ